MNKNTGKTDKVERKYMNTLWKEFIITGVRKNLKETVKDGDIVDDDITTQLSQNKQEFITRFKLTSGFVYEFNGYKLALLVKLMSNYSPKSSINHDGRYTLELIAPVDEFKREFITFLEERVNDLKEYIDNFSMSETFLLGLAEEGLDDFVEVLWSGSWMNGELKGLSGRDDEDPTVYAYISINRKNGNLELENICLPDYFSGVSQSAYMLLAVSVDRDTDKSGFTDALMSEINGYAPVN